MKDLMEHWTVREFADHFIPSNEKVRVVYQNDTIFDGTLEELYYSGSEVLALFVAMVGAIDDKICLSCRK